MMDKRITHIVYLSISVLLQPPGMKMNVPYAISRLKHGSWLHGCVPILNKKNQQNNNMETLSEAMEWIGKDWFGLQSEVGGLCFESLLDPGMHLQVK